MQPFPRRSAGAVAFVLAALLSPAASARAQTARSAGRAASRLEALRPALEKRIAAFHGTVGLAIFDLESGDSLAIRGDTPFPTASLIKVPVLVELFHQIEAGRLHLDDPLIMLDADRVPGSGVLQLMRAPHRLTVQDAAYLMVVLSDNTASNLLIGEVGVRHVNARMDSLGLPRTTLYRKLFMPEESIEPDSSAIYGVGVTTPMEMARLFDLIARGRAISSDASRRMVAMLKQQRSEDRIPRELPAAAVVAHKTGEIDAARHDCGIVYTTRPDFVLCVLTKDIRDRSWRVDNAANLLIADLAGITYEGLVGPVRAEPAR